MKTFNDILKTTILSEHISPRPRAIGECQSSNGNRCLLCHAPVLDYRTEIVLKNNALKEFWKTLRIATPLDPIIPSPLGRNYRTISKRKAFAYRGGVKLGLISPNEDGELRPLDVVQCAIEPIDHATIYQHIQASIDKPYAKRFAKALSYVVIKGNYKEQTIIFNVRDISQEVLHGANTLSKSLTKRYPTLVGVFLYEDESSPQYYLGTRNQSQRPKFKKLFGKTDIFLRVLGRSFLYSPLSFSQVNHSILEKLIRTVEELLLPTKDTTLFDLYCGYGMFALCFAEKVNAAVGVEISSASIESAIANAKRQKTSNARFIRTDINEESIERVMKNARPNDVVILDPPRRGAAPGVIECIATKRPRNIVHLFCETDVIAHEMKRWEKNGYSASRAIPFDMFPGTATIETMVLLEPDVA